MPLLADAYSEAHLDLSTLERDLDGAEARILSAFQAVEEAATVVVNLDITEALVKIKELEAALKAADLSATVTVDDKAATQAAGRFRDNFKDVLDGESVFTVDSSGIVDQTRKDIQDGFDRNPIDLPFSDGSFKDGLTSLLEQLGFLNDFEATARLDDTQLREALAVLAELKAAERAASSDVDIGVRGEEELLKASGFAAALREAVEAVDGTNVDIDANIRGLRTALADLVELGVEAKAVSAEDVNIDVTVDKGGGGFRTALQGIKNSLGDILSTFGGTGKRDDKTLSGVLGNAQDGFKAFGQGASTILDGIKEALGGGNGGAGISGGLSQLKGGFDDLGKSVKGLGDSIPGLDGITGFLGTGAQALGTAQAYGLLGSTIAGLIAYVIPLATGLVSAAGGLLAFAAAGTVAVGALGALSVVFDDLALANLKQQFGQFKNAFTTLLKDALAPAQSLILDEFVPSLLGGLGPLFLQLSQFIVPALRPITDAVLNLEGAFTTLAPALGQIAVATGSGIGTLIDTFTGFLANVDTAGAVQAINSLFGALNAILNLLGQTGLAFAPILTQLFDGLTSVTNDAVSPFLQIIGTFAQAVGPLGESISNILSPIGDLAITIGQAVAALAPELDTLFGLVTSFIPTLNFDVVRTALDAIIPAVVSTLQQLSPLIDQISAGFVELTAAIFNDNNTSAFGDLIGVLVFSVSQLVDVLVSNKDAVAGFFQVLIRGAAGAVAIGSILSATYFGIQYVVASALDIVGTAVGVLLDKIGELINLAGDIPGIGSIVPDGLGDRIRSVGDGFKNAADGFRDFSQNATSASVKVGVAATGIVTGQTSIEDFGGATAGARKELKSFAVQVDTVVGSLKLVGPEARKAAAGLEVVRKQFSGTTALLDGLAESTKPGKLGIKDALAASAAELNKLAKSTKGAASNLADEVRSITGGVDLGAAFVIPDATTNKAESAAKKVADSVGKFLGAGKLSEFVEKDERDVNRALDRLVRSLQQKAENIARLKLLDSLGFTDLAVQLATLKDSPGTLGKFLNQLFAGGAENLRAQNDRLSAERRKAEASLQGLSPSLAAALGEDPGKAAADKIQKGSTSIQEAIGKLSSDIRTKADNVRRLQGISDLGFSDLAVNLATLNGDPTKLKAALDQLAAGGVAAYRNANSQLVGARTELQRAVAGTDPLLAQALGQGPDAGKQTVDAINKSKGNIFDALESVRAGFVIQLENIRRVFFLEKAGAGTLADNLAVEFAGDPKGLKDALDQLFAAGIGKIKEENTKLETAIGDATAVGAQLDPRIAAALGVDPGSLTAEQLQAFQNRVNGAVDTTGLRGGFFKSQEEAIQRQAATALSGPLVEQAKSFGEQYATVVAEGIEGAKPQISKRIQDALTAIFGGGDKAAFFPLQKVGEDQANSFIQAVVNELDAVGLLLIGKSLATLFGNLAKGTTTAAGLTGLAAGLSFGAQLAQSLTTSSLFVGAAFGDLFNALGVVGNTAGELTGFAAGVSIDTGLVNGITFAGPLVSDAIGRVLLKAADDLRTNVGNDEFAKLGAGIAGDLADGFSLGLTVKFAFINVQAALLALQVAQTIRNVLGIRSPSTVAATIGSQFGDGLVLGLLNAVTPVQAAADRLAAATTANIAPPPITVDVVPRVTGDAAQLLQAATTSATAGTPGGALPITVDAASVAVGGVTAAQGTSDATTTIADKLDALIAAIQQVQPLIGEYNVIGVTEPQSPDQLAKDAAFAKALLS